MENYKVIFESKNIYYIQVTELLINDYLKMLNNYEIQKNISHKLKHFTYEQELEWVKSKIIEKANVFTMIEKVTGEFIGNVEISHITNGIGEIGICITEGKQDNHYGQEAMKAIIDYGYRILNLDGFVLNVYKTNSKAIHCYEKVGFVPDGTGKTEEDMHMVLR